MPEEKFSFATYGINYNFYLLCSYNGFAYFLRLFFRAVSATTAAPFGQIKIKHLNA